MELKVSIKTLGCRLNQAESAELSARFLAAGLTVVQFGEDCDACVLHSCAVTAKAETETVRLTRVARRRWPAALVVLTGCVAETAAADVRARTGADWIVPQEGKHELPARLAAHFGLAADAAGLRGSVTPAFDSTRALLRIQEGCSFGCAYCIVPRARGPARSRPMDAILTEAAALAGRGHKEIVVTGTNIGTWRDGPRDLVDLLTALERIPAIGRLRVGSVEPATVELPLLGFIAASERICRYIHLPMQSGDDAVLAAMGRRYDTARFRQAIEKAAALVPPIGIGTDIVTGFPGETERAFEQTLALVRDYPFSNLHVFPYSERPGTRAATMPGRVEPRIRRERARRLTALGEEKRQVFAAGFVGKPVTLLVERVERGGNAVGWTGEYLEAVVSATPAVRNQLLTMTPRSARDGRLMDI